MKNHQIPGIPGEYTLNVTTFEDTLIPGKFIRVDTYYVEDGQVRLGGGIIVRTGEQFSIRTEVRR